MEVTDEVTFGFSHEEFTISLHSAEQKGFTNGSEWFTIKISKGFQAEDTVMTIAKPGKFNRQTNPGTRICESCGRRRQVANFANGAIGGKLCEDCYDEAGWENEHMDGYHLVPVPELCPTCRAQAQA